MRVDCSKRIPDREKREHPLFIVHAAPAGLEMRVVEGE